MRKKREKKSNPEPSRSEADLKELARAIHHNEVFVATDERTIKQSFCIVLAFIDKKMIEDMAKKDVVAFYEYYNDPKTGANTHGPMRLNGFPMFHSLRVLTRGDYTKVMGYCDKIRLAEEKALEG